jgi:hypothetical protein
MMELVEKPKMRFDEDHAVYGYVYGAVYRLYTAF